MVTRASKSTRREPATDAPAEVKTTAKPAAMTASSRTKRPRATTTDGVDKAPRKPITRVRPADAATAAYATTGSTGEPRQAPGHTSGSEAPQAHQRSPLDELAGGLLGALLVGIDAAVDPTPQSEARAARTIDGVFAGLERTSRELYPDLWKVLGL